MQKFQILHNFSTRLQNCKIASFRKSLRKLQNIQICKIFKLDSSKFATETVKFAKYSNDAKVAKNANFCEALKKTVKYSNDNSSKACNKN